MVLWSRNAIFMFPTKQSKAFTAGTNHLAHASEQMKANVSIENEMHGPRVLSLCHFVLRANSSYQNISMNMY